MNDPTPAPAGLLRRLGGMLYDGLLLLAVLMIATALFLPLTGGEAINPRVNPVLEWVYRATLLRERYYEHYAMILFMQDVDVLRAGKF